MTGLGDVREQLVGALGRQYELAQVGQKDLNYFNVGRAAISRIIELRQGPIYDPAAAEIPALATQVKENADFASGLSGDAMETARYSESAFSGAFTGSEHALAREIVAKAGLQVDALESIVTVADTAMDKMEAVPGNAPDDMLRDVDHSLIEGEEIAKALSERAVGLHNDVNVYLQEQGIAPISWPPGHA